MTNRIVNLIQWASIVIGITGMSFDKLMSVQPTISYLLISLSILAFAVLVLMQFFYRDPNQFNTKQEVNSVWNTLLIEADRSVFVFAGDVSWAQNNQDTLDGRRRAGVELRVICRWPSSENLLTQVRALFAAGAEVKFYLGDLIKVRGLIVDTEGGFESGTALTVLKQPKKSPVWNNEKFKTDRLFNYKARRYIPSEDLNYIAMLHQLFDANWERLPRGIVLTRTDVSKTELLDLLTSVTHYKHLTEQNIAYRRIPLAGLYSCCKTVKAVKLPEAAALLTGYQQFGLEPFEPCLLEQSGNQTLILPPIVEQQTDGRLMVIDGMHRLYQLGAITDSQEAMCLVLDGVGALPSEPILFQDVRVTPSKKPRLENFPHFKPALFRDIKAIDKALAVAATRRSSTRI